MLKRAQRVTFKKSTRTNIRSNRLLVTGDDMDVPKLQEVQFSPLMWKESIIRGSTLRTIDELYSYFREHARECGWCKGIRMDEFLNTRIKRLVNGYIIFDFLEWDGKIELKYKMWQLFEDFVGEVLREALRDRTECTVVPVDKAIRGLDYVVANSKCKDGWTVGIQCKRYIRSAIPKSRLKDYRSWSRGTSAAQLIRKGKELHEKWGPGKRFVLIAFRAFTEKASHEQRFRELKQSWDNVLVIDKSKTAAIPYTYKVALPELHRIASWC